MPRNQRGRNAQAQSDENLPHCAAHHHCHHARPRRAQRHTDADFAGTARDEVGHDPVEADRSENQRQHAEEARQSCNQAVLVEVAGHLRIECAKVPDGERRVDAGQRLTNQRIRILLRPVEG